MIQNKHRDLYKIVKNNYKNEKYTSYPVDSEEYSLCQELVDLGYLNKIEKQGEMYFITTPKSLPRKPREKALKKLIVNQTKIQIPIQRCEKPKFGGRGRTWDSFTRVVDNIDVEFHLDTSWGNYIYFSAQDDRWYKIPVTFEYSFNDDNGERVQNSINTLMDKVNHDYTLK